MFDLPSIKKMNDRVLEYKARTALRRVERKDKPVACELPKPALPPPPLR